MDQFFNLWSVDELLLDFEEFLGKATDKIGGNLQPQLVS
jgi:hypothetical protein